jgi:hypothetical protein
MWYNYGSGIDFTSGTFIDNLFFIWLECSTPGLTAARSSGGIEIRLGTDTSNYRRWYIGGNDHFLATEQFICYVIDPQSAGSADVGTYNAASVQYFGGVITTTATAKGQNLGIDQIAVGRGEIVVSGTVATAGEGFKEIAATVFDSARTNRWGVVTTKSGTLFVKGKLIIGHQLVNASAAWTVAVSSNVVTVQTITPHFMTTNSTFSTDANWTVNSFMASLSGKTVASIPTATSFTFALTQANQGATTETDTAAEIGADTTFSSQGENVVWETPEYYDSSTNIVQTIPDAGVQAAAGQDGESTYNGLAFMGGPGTTNIDVGVIAGTANGRSGSTFSCPENDGLTSVKATAAKVSANDETMALDLYGATFQGFSGGVDLKGTGIDGDDCFSCTFDNCGRLTSNMELRNCNILNSAAAADDGAYLWESTTDLESCLFDNNSRAIVFESTSGTPFDMVNVTFGTNTVDIRNESGGAITINYSGDTTPDKEDIGGGSATTIINAVTVKVTVQKKDATKIQGARVFLEAAPTGALPSDDSVTIISSGTTASVTHTTHGLSNGDKVAIRGANEKEYNGVFAITNVAASSYDYTMGGDPDSPATGTITSTAVILDGDSDAGGIVQDTGFNYGAAQPVRGKVRKGSASPYYQTTDLIGSIGSGGYDKDAIMILDE